jgi:hypothetical protein
VYRSSVASGSGTGRGFIGRPPGPWERFALAWAATAPAPARPHGTTAPHRQEFRSEGNPQDRERKSKATIENVIARSSPIRIGRSLDTSCDMTGAGGVIGG